MFELYSPFVRLAKMRNYQHGHFGVVFDHASVSLHVMQHSYEGQGTDELPFLVEFLPNDPHDPMAFPKWKKWLITMVLAVATLAVAFVSTAYSSGIEDIMEQFEVATEIAMLGLALFLVGLAVGPILWAPSSEEYGRQYIFLGSYFAHVVFNAGAAGAQSIQALIVLRFFSAFFGAAPYTNASAVIADMFPAAERGLALTVFSAAPFLGPAIGPIAGGFLGKASGWRWIQGLMAFFTGVALIASSICVPETYTPVILRRRAARLSEMTGKKHVSLMLARQGCQSIQQRVSTALARPWVLFFHEPIVSLTAIYISVVYGTLYLFFAAFPIVYQYGRGWPLGVSGLAFIGTAVGMLVAIAYVAVYDNRRYARMMKRNNGPLVPEARLPAAMMGSVLITIGLFWFAWTNGPGLHWSISIVASAFFGAGMVLVFVGISNYLIDSYVIYAASALASNTILRSLFGAAFPLFTTQMYNNLGIHWASSIPAFLSLVCLPVPFIFYRYGASIRTKCKYATQAAAALELMKPTITVVPDSNETKSNNAEEGS
ncbi:MFS-type efflux pump MFS2 [Paramyrothecium foliicola]|nr:MFS-type efflux pump MFS2 [Paramyrothecium foliicola]